MFGFMRKAALGAVLAATVVAASNPAEARDRRHRGDDRAAIAVGAGILGLAVGAAIASDNRDRYYDDRYYYRPPPPRYRYRYAPPPPPRYYRYDRYDRHYPPRYYRRHW